MGAFFYAKLAESGGKGVHVLSELPVGSLLKRTGLILVVLCRGVRLILNE
jgi:hypothetical protein